MYQQSFNKNTHNKYHVNNMHDRNRLHKKY